MFTNGVLAPKNTLSTKKPLADHFFKKKKGGGVPKPLHHQIPLPPGNIPCLWCAGPALYAACAVGAVVALGCEVVGCLQRGGGLHLGTTSTGKTSFGENFLTCPILMQGHQTSEEKISLDTLNPWFFVDNMEFLGLALLSFLVCKWAFFAVAPHSFHFIAGAHVITYSCPTCNS